jgi:cobalt-zinc-cadmium efflux system protein
VRAPTDFGVAFAIGTVLNLGFVITEVVYGLLANSIALVADAGHNLGDVLGLVMAWAATVLARRAPSRTYTYGLRRGTILAALANAVLLLVTVGAIAVEGVRRLIEPSEVTSVTIMVVAAVGIVINGVTAWLFASGRKGDINLRAAFMHMVYDAVVSAGVVAAGGVILLTGWTRFWQARGTCCVTPLACRSMRCPPGSSPMRSVIFSDNSHVAIHDLHIWPMSTTETALTCHFLMPGGHPGGEFLVQLAHQLHERFSIGHATIQVESDEHIVCALEADHEI